MFDKSACTRKQKCSAPKFEVIDFTYTQMCRFMTPLSTCSGLDRYPERRVVLSVQDANPAKRDASLVEPIAFLGGGGCSIQNANSAEDLNQRLMGSPMGLIYEFDVRALADYGQFMDTVAQAFEKQSR